MSEPLAAKRTTAVKCEKHGLHYDPRMDGCVICRREAGGGSAAARTAPQARGSMPAALCVTALLLLLATACLYFAHGLVIAAFQKARDAEALDTGFAEPRPEMSFPAEDSGGPVYPGSEGN